jgi:hypothetical protein
MRSRGAKTGAIRSVINKSSKQGVTPGEIRRAIKGQVDPKYLYKSLARMKSRGEIKSSMGRYYPVVGTSEPKITLEPSPASHKVSPSPSSSHPTQLQLDHELDRMKRDFDEYRRGYKDGWDAAMKNAS